MDIRHNLIRWGVGVGLVILTACTVNLPVPFKNSIRNIFIVFY